MNLASGGADLVSAVDSASGGADLASAVRIRRTEWRRVDGLVGLIHRFFFFSVFYLINRGGQGSRLG
jgi:hypothetical protein